MYLSNIELYYSHPENFINDEVLIDGDDYHHIIKVMRHKSGDELFVTNGKGKIFKGEICRTDKEKIVLHIKETFSYKNVFRNIFFCIPKIKNTDRFEFALEKCVELGITNFIIYESERSLKKGDKVDRWNKILLAAMKQSLLSYLPLLKVAASLDDIIKTKGEIIILDQNAQSMLKEFKPDKEKFYYFIFGPEGGLTESELKTLSESANYRLADNRLRTETAVIYCAALINSLQI